MTFCEAEIVQKIDMKDIVPYFEKATDKTLVIFDVDMVIVQPSDPAFQMANMKRHGIVAKRIMQSIPQEHLMLFLSLMTLRSETILIDHKMPEYLQILFKKNTPTIALTANITGSFAETPSVELWRIESLRRLGIDFSNAAPYKAHHEFKNLASYRNNYSTYVDGMLFVNGRVVSKGDALLAYLNLANLCPNEVIFIDDREDNLKSVEQALKTRTVPPTFIGIHFQGAELYPSTDISEHDFENRWMALREELEKLEK